MTSLESVIGTLRAQEPALRAMGVSLAAVFGSIASSIFLKKTLTTSITPGPITTTHRIELAWQSVRRELMVIRT